MDLHIAALNLGQGHWVSHAKKVTTVRAQRWQFAKSEMLQDSGSAGSGVLVVGQRKLTAQQEDSRLVGARQQSCSEKCLLCVSEHLCDRDEEWQAGFRGV